MNIRCVAQKIAIAVVEKSNKDGCKSTHEEAKEGNFNPSSEGISDQASRPIQKGEFMVMEAA